MLVMSICTFICVATIFTAKFCIWVFFFEMPIQRLLAVVQNFLANEYLKYEVFPCFFFKATLQKMICPFGLAAGELGSGLPGGGLTCGGLPGGE